MCLCRISTADLCSLVDKAGWGAPGEPSPRGPRHCALSSGASLAGEKTNGILVLWSFQEACRSFIPGQVQGPRGSRVLSARLCVVAAGLLRQKTFMPPAGGWRLVTQCHRAWVLLGLCA